jgi:hypothetical protein
VFAIRERSSGSWLDPSASGLLGWKLGRRLLWRCRGHRGVFVTLTYRREGYSSPLELYRRQAERQDVPLFIRRLSRALGVSFKGKWLCKLEFQQGGWVHWHIVLLGVRRIEFAVLKRCWTHGFPWISKITPRTCMYLTKYVAKGGQLPAWIYLEKPKSVKIVRVSPGFWPEDERAPATPKDDYDRYGPGPGQCVDGYVPIGEKLNRRGVLVRHGRRGETIRFRSCSFPTLMCVLVVECKARCIGRRGQWVGFAGPVELFEEAAARAASSGRDPQRTQRSRGEPPRSGVHLIGNSNPDAMPWYLNLCFEELWSEEVLHAA